MNTSAIATGLIALLVIAYLITRLLRASVVSQRSVRTPAIIAIALGVPFLYGNPALDVVVTVCCGAVFGLFTGLFSGQFIRVWRGQDGFIYQQGDWRYLVTLLVFLALRVAARFALGHILSPTALNDAFIAAILGNYLGRAASVYLRAAPLVGHRFEALPRR